MLARDNEGVVICEATGYLVHQTEALHAEASTLLNAIQVAEIQGIGRIVFETDCMALQHAVSSTSLDHGPLGVLFRLLVCSSGRQSTSFS